MSEAWPSDVNPPTLSRLQSAQGPEREEAWAAFVAAHSDLLLHVCRSLGPDHDTRMDAYAFVLQALRENEYRRLRSYTALADRKFNSWLVVVVRRIALDFIRQKYGRSRSEDETRRDAQSTRRRLEDMVAAQIDPEQLGDDAGGPDAAIRRAQLVSALKRVIDALDSRDRLLLVLRFVDERPMRDIARAIGLPSVFHAYRRLAATLSTLRRALERGGVEGTEP